MSPDLQIGDCIQLSGMKDRGSMCKFRNAGSAFRKDLGRLYVLECPT